MSHKFKIHPGFRCPKARVAEVQTVIDKRLPGARNLFDSVKDARKAEDEVFSDIRSLVGWVQLPN